jgi:hypothetical protein
MNDFNKNKLKSELLPFFTQLLKFFDFFELPKNESFSLSHDLFKSFENLDFPSWNQFYPIHKDSAESSFPSLSEKEIDEELNLVFDNEEKLIRESRIINEIRKLSTKDQLEGKNVFLNQKQADHILTCYAWMNFSMIAGLFGKSPFVLFEEAKSGNRDSILKLIQLDKTFTGADWSMREIKKAHLSGDQEYFNKLAKALAKNPFASKKTNLKLCFVLVFGWEMELGKLSNDEILGFVKELGIYEGDDPDTLYREIKRLGLKKRTQKVE